MEALSDSQLLPSRFSIFILVEIVEFGEEAEPTMVVLQSEVVTMTTVDLLAPTMAVLQSKAPTMAVDSEAANMSATCRANRHRCLSIQPFFRHTNIIHFQLSSLPDCTIVSTRTLLEFLLWDQIFLLTTC